jgi:NACHT domain-containing protein
MITQVPARRLVRAGRSRSLATGAVREAGGGDSADRRGGYDQHDVLSDRGVNSDLRLIDPSQIGDPNRQTIIGCSYQPSENSGQHDLALVSMRRRRVLLLEILGALGFVETVLIGLAIGPTAADKHWPGPLDYVRAHHWAAITILAVIGGIVTVWVILATREPQPPIDLKTMADDLAGVVRTNWFFETQRWHILDPYPLPVGWVPADQDLLASWTSIVRLAEGWPAKSRTARETWAHGPNGLKGGNDDLAEVLARVPTGRLVVLGERGAGKTILLIRTVLRLIDRREQGEAVPFFLPMASWNPSEQDLISWMAEWMATTWEPLGRPASEGSSRTIARALIEAGLVMPVLDGLDEIAKELRNLAISRINEATGHIQGIILSCRAGDYETAVRPRPGVENTLAGAAGIVLIPLPAEEVAAYLMESAGGPIGAARWAPVIKAMRKRRPRQVAEVFASPLMAALARAIYNPPPKELVTTGRRDPSELLDKIVFPGREDIERHLYDKFIPACYLQHPNPRHPSRRFRWTAEQAEKWFGFLARYLEDPDPKLRTTDFLWWQLDRLLRPRETALVLCAIFGLVAAIGYPFWGFGLGTLAGIGVGIITRRWLPAKKDGIARGLVARSPRSS